MDCKIENKKDLIFKNDIKSILGLEPGASRLEVERSIQLSHIDALLN